MLEIKQCWLSQSVRDSSICVLKLSPKVLILSSSGVRPRVVQAVGEGGSNCSNDIYHSDTLIANVKISLLMCSRNSGMKTAVQIEILVKVENFDLEMRSPIMRSWILPDYMEPCFASPTMGTS